MIIVHAPTEIAGQMRALVSGLRQAGYKANGYNWFQSYLNYIGSVINTDAYELIKLIDPLVNYVDLFHFHNGNTFVVNNYDVPRQCQASVGSHLRCLEREPRRNLFLVSALLRSFIKYK
ncbi:hypothetical protein [Paenibacillus sp.]|uniref:hypothetical protein n=1 Tax=Paenibacillus sp. TaxID=58172 RepID=UPI003562A0B8